MGWLDKLLSSSENLDDYTKTNEEEQDRYKGSPYDFRMQDYWGLKPRYEEDEEKD